MKYIVNVESSINWTEETNTVEEAVTLIRELVETDKRYTFAGTTNLRFNSHGKDATMSMQVKWLWHDEEGKAHMMCKTIRQLGYTYADYRREHPLPKRHNPFDDWDSIVAMFK